MQRGYRRQLRRLRVVERGGAMAQVESKNRATSDPDARKGVLKDVAQRGIDDVLLWFTDLEGHLKSFSITISEVEGALDDGMGFDGSSITGFNAIEESDMGAIPDPAAFRVAPYGPERDPRPRDVPLAARRPDRPDDLRRRHARRPAIRGRPPARAPPRARPD